VETTFKLPKIRLGHRVDIADTACYWFEMDHPGESPRQLLDIFDYCLNHYQWDKFIPPGSTVIDVGAHSGDTAVPMQFVSRGTVLAVEPNPIIRPYLELTCNMNGHLGKFIVADEAVTVEDTDALEILDHNNALCNGGRIDPTWSPELQQRMMQMAGDKITVRGLTLEHMCEKYLTPEEIENISFIKTDTEGHDISIIESSKDLIQRLKPILFIEWFFAFTDVENKHMFAVIEDLGYQAFDPTTMEPADINKPIADLVCIHKSKISEYL
jgi:FkbM family methyltransferase